MPKTKQGKPGKAPTKTTSPTAAELAAKRKAEEERLAAEREAQAKAEAAEALRREQIAAEVAKRRAEAAAASTTTAGDDERGKDDKAAAVAVKGVEQPAKHGLKEVIGKPVVMAPASAPAPVSGSSTGAMLSGMPVSEGFHYVDPLVSLSLAQREILQSLDAEVEMIFADKLPGDTPYPKYLVAYLLQATVALYESSWRVSAFDDEGLRSSKVKLAQLVATRACSLEYTDWPALLVELRQVITNVNKVGRYLSATKGQGVGSFESFINLAMTLLAKLERQFHAEYWQEQILAPVVCPDLTEGLPKGQALSLLGLASTTKGQVEASVFLKYVDQVYRKYWLSTDLSNEWQSSIMRHVVHRFGDAGEKFTAKKTLLLKGVAHAWSLAVYLPEPSMARQVELMCDAAITGNAEIESKMSGRLQVAVSAASSVAAATATVMDMAGSATRWAWRAYQGSPASGVAAPVEEMTDMKAVEAITVKFSLAALLDEFKTEYLGARAIVARGESVASSRASKK